MKKLTLSYAADHPTGSGHFPGNPIIPGALLLAEVLLCIGRAEGLRFTPCKVRSAKFLHPVRPGDRVDIEYACPLPGKVDFRCAVAGGGVLSGGADAPDHA